MNHVFKFIYFSMWIAGCVLAKGFWSTFFAVCTGGLWSAYLVFEKMLLIWGVV